MALGQAAGTAAALAVSAGTTPRDVAVDTLQAALERDGAILHQERAISRAADSRA
jgi:hypothetical protein